MVGSYEQHERSDPAQRRDDHERERARREAHDLLTGAYIDPKKARTTVGEYYRVWSVRQRWRPSSRAAIETKFARHVLPTFENRPLGSVRRGDLETWAASSTLSAQAAGTTLRYFATMLEAAVIDGLLASNPARGAKAPLVDLEPVRPFTLDELEALRTAAPAWFRVALTLGAAAGLRQGEATGLSLDRLNMLGRELRVDRQLVTPASGPVAFGLPKTARSHRTVPLADVALVDLARHLHDHGTGADGLVLHEEGAPIARQRFGRLWRALREKAGLPGARFHDTRHTFASTLLSGGVSVAAAAEYLGHSPAVLLKTYAHLMPADHDRARAVVQAAFGRAEDELRTARDG
jgi:integrase